MRRKNGEPLEEEFPEEDLGQPFDGLILPSRLAQTFKWERLQDGAEDSKKKVI